MFMAEEAWKTDTVKHRAEGFGRGGRSALRVDVLVLYLVSPTHLVEIRVALIEVSNGLKQSHFGRKSMH